jgi:L-fucose isomerase-like protein
MPIKSPIYLVASGDSRLAANQTCWAAQDKLEKELDKAFQSLGHTIKRAHPYDETKKHGFVDSQRYGMKVFASLPSDDVPLIVAEAVWQYSHHVLAGLTTHKGPILTVANWSGQWPGLVGMLNLNGSLTKAGVKYSTLWSVDFTDEFFLSKLKEWLETETIKHDLSHARPLKECKKIPDDLEQIGTKIAEDLLKNKAIMGVFDEGCMGMYNAIIPDELLHKLGIFKERLSQSALYFEMQETKDDEAFAVYDWLKQKGMKFDLKDQPNDSTDLTEEQIIWQCKMYIAAVRLANDFGCDLIGIQYQLGLKDLVPASDLAEGLLNNVDRPPVKDRANKTLLFENAAVPHFNEVDECAGVDALITNRVWNKLGYSPETTLHDVRYGEDYDGVFTWVFEISGAVPPEHLTDGYKGSFSLRQPPMYFQKGGGTIRGVSKPGEVVWSRIYTEDARLKADIGRALVVELPTEETERRWRDTTPQWPIMHAQLLGVSRDQLMAKHKANHVQVAYAPDAEGAKKALAAKAACFQALGIEVIVCGTESGLN